MHRRALSRGLNSIPVERRGGQDPLRKSCPPLSTSHSPLRPDDCRQPGHQTAVAMRRLYGLRHENTMGRERPSHLLRAHVRVASRSGRVSDSSPGVRNDNPRESPDVQPESVSFRAGGSVIAEKVARICTGCIVLDSGESSSHTNAAPQSGLGGCPEVPSCGW